MGYTIYWEAKRDFTKQQLNKMNMAFMLEYNKVISRLKAKGMDTGKYEWVGNNPMSNKNFEFIKTNRIPYDYAVKKALIEVQKVSNNGYKITCDDGFKYIKSGLIFDGNGLIDKYKIVKPIFLQLEDLPIKYKSKGKGILSTGEYSWNKGKKYKEFFIKKVNSFKLQRGKRGGIFYMNSKGHKTYCDKHCCKK